MDQVFSERIREGIIIIIIIINIIIIIIIIIICENLPSFLYHAETALSLDVQKL